MYECRCKRLGETVRAIGESRVLIGVASGIEADADRNSSSVPGPKYHSVFESGKLPIAGSLTNCESELDPVLVVSGDSTQYGWTGIRKLLEQNDLQVRPLDP